MNLGKSLNVDVIWHNCVLLAVTCFVTLSGCKASSDTSEQWKTFLLRVGVEQNQVLCEGRQNNDHFLIAVVDKKLLTAFRVDVTGENGRVRPTIISWSFRNEDGSGLESNVPPAIIVGQFVEERGRLFSERADYRQLFLEGSAEVQVRIAIQKEGSGVKIPKDGPYDLGKLKKSLLCSIPVEELSKRKRGRSEVVPEKRTGG